MTVVSGVISAALFLTFLGWGIYTLRLRYSHHEDLSMRLELATLAAVTVFVAVELMLVRPSLANNPVLYVFTILGLAVAATALYGPMLVSVASKVFVDAVIADHRGADDGPQFGPVDALERVNDFEGALGECLVLSRMFPKDATVSIRAATNYASLERYSEAAEWFERGLSRVNDADRAFRVTNRLAEIYNKQLDRADDADRVLRQFIERYPDHERADSIQRRIDRAAPSAAIARPIAIPDSPSE